MLMTITNVTATTHAPGFTINTPDTGLAGVSADAVGGNKLYALPYPFSHVGPILVGATKALTIHNEDLRYKSVPWLPFEPSREWQMLIQQGIVTVAFTKDVVGTTAAGVPGFEDLQDQANVV